MKAVTLMCIAALGLAVATGALRGGDDKLVENQMVKPQMGRVRKPEQVQGEVPQYTKSAEGAAEEEKAVPKFKPSMVPSGHFSGKPVPSEPVKPEMTTRGGLAAAREAEAAAERAKHAPEIAAAKAAQDAEKQSQVATACKRMEAVRTLATMMYEQEKDSASGTSRAAIAALISTNCPHIKSGSPQAAAALNCDKVSKEVASYFDAKFVGKLPQTQADRCSGKKVAVRNFAVSQALHSSNNMFDVTFCPTVAEFNPCPADAAAKAKADATDAAAEDEDATDAETAAESDDAEAAANAAEERHAEAAEEREVSEFDDSEQV